MTRRVSNLREVSGGFHANDDPELELRDTSHAGTRARDSSIVGLFQRARRRRDARRTWRRAKPGAHWTMDKAMDVIRAACEEEDRQRRIILVQRRIRGWDHSEPGTFGSSRVGREGEGETTTPSFDAYASETFVYREEIDAHEFFRPVVDLALSGR